MKHVAEILREMKLFPEPADLERKPPGRQQECAFCHQTFTTNPQWFGSGWKHGLACENCAVHGAWARILRDREFWQNIASAPVRLSTCPSCYQDTSARPRFERGLWHYVFRCPKCGYETYGLYRLKTICELCQKPMFMDEDRAPLKRCRPCLKEQKEKGKLYARDGDGVREIDDPF